MTDKVYAPWTPSQVQALNRFQQSGRMHPFTCGEDHPGPALHLVAEADGWRCWLPGCEYRQDWAHAFMAEPVAEIVDGPQSVTHNNRAAAPPAPASTAPLAAGLPDVVGRCPACGYSSLFLGHGGYVTCSMCECPQPDAASTVLERDPGVVTATFGRVSNEASARADQATRNGQNMRMGLAPAAPADPGLRDRIASVFRKWHRSPDQPLYTQGAEAVMAELTAAGWRPPFNPQAGLARLRAEISQMPATTDGDDPTPQDPPPLLAELADADPEYREVLLARGTELNAKRQAATVEADPFANGVCTYGEDQAPGAGCLKPAGHDGAHLVTPGDADPLDD